MRLAAVITLIIVFLALFYIGRATLVDPGSRLLVPGPDTSFRRIASTAPSITEILFALKAEDLVAGVTRYCEYPPGARNKTVLGDYYDLNMEVLVAVKPDLVVLTEGAVHENLVAAFRGLSLSTVSVDHDSLLGILDSIRVLGEHSDRKTESRLLLDRLRTRIDEIRVASSKRKPKSVLLAIGKSLDGESFKEAYTAGTTTFYQDLLQITGSSNACAVSKVAYPRLSPEEIFALNPDVIVDLSRGAQKSEWQDLSELPAIREGRLLMVDADYATIPGPRIIKFLEDLARYVHPGLEI